MPPADRVHENARVKDATVSNDHHSNMSNVAVQSWQDIDRSSTRPKSGEANNPQFLDMSNDHLYSSDSFSSKKKGEGGDVQHAGLSTRDRDDANPNKDKANPDVITPPKDNGQDRNMIDPNQYMWKKSFNENRPMDENGKHQQDMVRVAAQNGQSDVNLPKPAGKDVNSTKEKDGHLSEVTVHNAEDHSRTNFELNKKGDVVSRTQINDKGEADKVRFDAQGKPIAHDFSVPGQKTKHLPIDQSDRVSTTVDEKGQVQGIHSQHGNESMDLQMYKNKVYSKEVDKTLADAGHVNTRTKFDENQIATGTDTVKTDADGKKTSRVFKDDYKTATDSFDQDGQLSKTATRTDKSYSETKYENGTVTTESINKNGDHTVVKRNPDESTERSLHNLKDGRTVTEKQYPDGSRKMDEDNKDQTIRSVTDGKTGLWINETVDKKTGVITKSYGAPNTGVESWQERRL